MDGQKENVQFLEGTLEEYNSVTKDPKAFYCTTDDEGNKELHFGEDKIVKEKDLNKYVHKLEGYENDNRVYVYTSYNGYDASALASSFAVANAFIRRTEQGTAKVSDPREGQDITNKQYVDAETAKLQSKTDETLNTEDKTIVGAINELYAREDKQGLTEEQVREIISTETKDYQTAEQVKDIVDEKIGDIDFSELQTKEDSELNTENKTIVGAINELAAREDKEGLNEEEVNELIAAAAENKVDKYTSGGASRIYAVGRDGSQKMVQVFDTPDLGSIQQMVPTYYNKASSVGYGSTMADQNGVLITAEPNQPYQAANKKYVDAVGDRVSLLEQQNEMMSQVIQPVEDTYLSKSFTQKISIFDNNGAGGKSKILSIEGNSAACKNLLDLKTLNSTDSNATITHSTREDGSIIDVTFTSNQVQTFFYGLGVLPKGTYTFTCGGATTNKTHPNYPTEKYYVANFINNGSTVVAENSIYPAQFTFTADGEHSVEVAFKKCTKDSDEVITLIRPQLEKNNYKTDFVPYYEGLKSPIVTGIQSKPVFKNSEQIVNNYFNSEYECGLGTIIDFENKKILNYGVTLEFNGTEKWAMGDGYARRSKSYISQRQS